MKHRSAAVAVAVTLQQLLEGKTSGWTFDQSLVLEALRRSDTELKGASDAELGEYIRRYTPEQLQGIASNVKGIFHELLTRHMENTDGDAISARIFEHTNHPGADVEFIVEGEIIREVQLKAVQDPASIVEHFSRYPGIDVMATSEAVEALEGIYGEQLTSSGFSNEELKEITAKTLEDLAGEKIDDLLQDGVISSVLLAGALQAKAALSGNFMNGRELKAHLELVGIATGTAMTVDTLLNLV